MIKTCLLGIGRTGMVVAEHLLKSNDFELVSIYTKPGSLKVNRKLQDLINTDSRLVIKDTNLLAAELRHKKIQVAIDFTNPKAAIKNARILAEQGVQLVIGTTGFNKIQINELKNIAEQNKVGIVYAPNISVGVNVLLLVVKTIAKLLPHYDVEISEYHHCHKKDAPSGTALKLATAINETKEIKQPRFIFGRFGLKMREKNEIGIHAIRAGGIIGVHKVLFSSNSDEIEVIHRSYSRAAFAEGALKAAEFIVNHQGFYNIEDILLLGDNHKNRVQDFSNVVSNWWRQIFERFPGETEGSPQLIEK